MNKKRMLMIVDPQVDFITGTLPVPGAEEAMDNLARHLYETDGRYDVKILTADWHPYDHQSFATHGGQWPRHCVHDTTGAAIWPGVFEAAYSTAGRSLVLHKGTIRDREEYSIFGNPDSAATIDRIISTEFITAIDLCGLVGDVCVLATLYDFRRLYPHLPIQVLLPYSPSLDDGTTLTQALK